MSRPTHGSRVDRHASRRDGVPLLTTLGRLLRVSLTVSAAADIAAGVVLGSGSWPSGGRPFLLVLASLCVYHGGMALNDWVDREHDARTRPERPLPSGAIAPGTALALGLGLLVLGPFLAAAVEPACGRLLTATAALALLYDVAGRGPWLGPTLLGLCRAGNLAAGLRLGLATVPERAAGSPLFDGLTLWGAPVLYGAYVFVISRLGRLEDGEDERPLGRRPARHLAAAAGILLGAPVVPLPLVPLPSDFPLASDDARLPVAALLAAVGAFPLLRGAFRPAYTWTHARVQEWMGVALRRLLFFTATLSLTRGTLAGACVAACILAGFPLSHALRRVFPPS